MYSIVYVITSVSYVLTWNNELQTMYEREREGERQGPVFISRTIGFKHPAITFFAWRDKSVWPNICSQQTVFAIEKFKKLKVKDDKEVCLLDPSLVESGIKLSFVDHWQLTSPLFLWSGAERVLPAINSTVIGPAIKDRTAFTVVKGSSVIPLHYERMQCNSETLLCH